MVDCRDIGDRIRRGGPVPVYRRERIAIAFECGGADAFTMCGGECVGKIIRPVARGLNTVGLNLGDRLGDALLGSVFTLKCSRARTSLESCV
jgi:hypothetical protein